ncbi:MAG: glycerol-3-phosphate responsive antiterminator [Bacillota bacterium]
MMFKGQKILPAVRSMKEFDKMLQTNYEYGVFLDLHIGMLKTVYQYAKENNRKMFLHLDLIQGLKGDEYGAQYVCQEIKPYGIISTKGKAIQQAKKKGVVAIQRAFVLDSSAMERSMELVKHSNPDYIELLPGVIPKVIKTIKTETGKPVFAGGLIDTVNEVEEAIEAGASAITTSNRELWKHFNPDKEI